MGASAMYTAVSHIHGAMNVELRVFMSILTESCVRSWSMNVRGLSESCLDTPYPLMSIHGAGLIREAYIRAASRVGQGAIEPGYKGHGVLLAFLCDPLVDEVS